ncbi:hypothetical protein [Methylotuvimicrobium buryatense]|uniref:hypothetical protein n=1 Tax=Methylotuvimicrobium buryatense TaxID=95641 RepID=UPI001F3FA684|nr:hypothetical protein [Methylotuvimicrobium buryatense]
MSELKHIISLRIENSLRNAVQVTASRFYVRESDIYRFAINYMLKRLRCLHEDDFTGSDLLPLMLDIREDLIDSLSLKKHQLFNIMNGNNTHPDKFVAMSDIELLLTPRHLLKQRLLKIDDTLRSDVDSETWLRDYLLEKYQSHPDKNAIPFVLENSAGD